MNRTQFACFLLTVFLITGGLFAQSDLSEIHHRAVQNAVNKVAASVVQIETVGGLEAVGETRTSSAPTTALVISSDGYALSSEFNFAKLPSAVFARLPNGQRVNVDIVARDTNRRLVLLKLDTTTRFSVPEIVDRENLVVGQSSIALGRAYKNDSINVSTGIVSATHRVWSKAVQTDAKISPANYGGPLINLKGQVIGLLVPLSPRGGGVMAGAEWYDSGIGFAVTLNPVLEKLEVLKSGSDLKPGRFGVRFKGTNMYRGAPEISVCPGHSPAGRAGLKPGDIITNIDGQAIIRQAQVRHALGPKYAGDTIEVRARRGESIISAKVELVADIEAYQAPYLGIIPNRLVANLTIGKIISGGAAEQAGLAKDDLITAINKTPVSNVDELQDLIAGIEIGGKIEVSFTREGNSQTTELTLSKLNGETFENPAQRPTDLTVGESSTTIKIPEFANESVCFLPKRAEGERLGLMVWIPEAGPTDHEKIWEQWKGHCERFGTALLIPKSMDRKRWTPDEAEFIAAAIKESTSRFAIDQNRLAVAGQATGASMAALVTAENRELIGGLALIDGGFSRRVASMDTDPNLRLFVMIGTDSKNKNAKGLSAGAERLKKKYFPVHLSVDQEKPNWPKLLNEWLNSIDRF